MTLWLRFWRSAAVWTGSAVLLVLLSSGYGAATRDHGIQGWPAVIIALTAVPAWVTVLLPLAAFPAGIAMADHQSHESPARSYGGRGRIAVIAVAGSAALLVFALIAYGAPLAEAWAASQVGTPPESGEAVAAETRPQVRAAYEQAVAEARSDPQFGAVGWSGPWHTANQLGYAYHLQSAVTALTLTMALLGVLVGRLSGAPGHGAWRTAVQRWAMAVLLVLWVALGVVVGRELSTQRLVPPALSAYLMLIVPLAVLGALAWAHWALAAWRGSHLRPTASP